MKVRDEVRVSFTSCFYKLTSKPRMFHLLRPLLEYVHLGLVPLLCFLSRLIRPRRCIHEDDPLPNLEVKMENCESPDRSAETAYWAEQSRKKDAECKASVLQAAKEAENNDPFQEETRIELAQIQLFTSTEREKAAGFKHIVQLGPGFFNIFKSSMSGGIPRYSEGYPGF